MALRFCFLFFMIMLCNITTIKAHSNNHHLPNFTSILVFGDSTVDTGNNNHLLTSAKGNHFPYGQDYPHHKSTGRFSNGRLVPDFLASSLNIKKNGVPPYLQPNLSEKELRSGVCFASGGTGFDELTSTISGAIPMEKQLDYFKEYLDKLNEIVGDDNGEEVERIVNGALVLVSAGTNDFIFNFYDLPTRRFQFSLSDYQDFLLDKVQSFIKDLYDLGCRNFIVNGLPPINYLIIQTCFLYIYNVILINILIRLWVETRFPRKQPLYFCEVLVRSAYILPSQTSDLYDLGCRNFIVNGLPPIGCLPIQITAKSLFSRNCIKNENMDSKMYNKKLEDLLLQLQEDLSGSKILYVDTYSFAMDLISRPKSHGFKETRKGCCGTGLIEAGPFCTDLSLVCPDPSRYIFFDSIHPTEATYKKAANYILKKLPKFGKN